MDVLGCLLALARQVDRGLFLSLRSWVGGALDWKDIRVTWSSPVVKIRESLLTESGNFPVRGFRGRSERDVVNLEVDKIRNQEPGFQSCSAAVGLGTPSKQFNLWLSVSLPKTGGKDIYLPERYNMMGLCACAHEP